MSYLVGVVVPHGSSYFMLGVGPSFLTQRKWSKKAPASGDCSPKSQCLGIIPPVIILYVPKTVPLMQNKNKIQLKFKKK